MSDKKNIDRLFQEKFKDFEAVPSDAVWDRISESLPKKKKKRRVIPLWWQIGGVAATIALLLTFGVSVFNTDDANSKDFPIVNSNKNINKKTNHTNKSSEDINSSQISDEKQQELKIVKDEKTKVADSNLDSEIKNNTNNSEEGILNEKKRPNASQYPSRDRQKTNVLATIDSEGGNTKKAKENSTLKNNSNKDNATKVAVKTKMSDTALETGDQPQIKSEIDRKSAIANAIEDNKTAVTENSSSQNVDAEKANTTTNSAKTADSELLIIDDSKQQTIEEAIAATKETINEEEKDDEQSRWSILPNVAPVYFSSLGQGSSLDQQFNENAKTSDINMSYGIAGTYAISKKLRIRAGVNRVNLNQSTSDVFAFTGAETAARGASAEFNNIEFKNAEQHVSLMSSTLMNRSSVPELFNTKTVGTIDQQFGFIEVPLELEYKVLDKKFGINVIGGFSTFILSENDIYADINGTSTLIGEANNINDTSFSANFGLGMDYNLSKQWHINLEPTFKYQINTFNNTTGDFRPFFIGVYTGLNYKF